MNIVHTTQKPKRLAFVNLAKPHAHKDYPDSAPKFKTSILIPDGDPLLDIIKKAIKDSFSDTKGMTLKKLQGIPLIESDEQDIDKYPFLEGMNSLKLTNKSHVHVVDKKLDAIEDLEDETYPGMWGNVKFEIYFYKGSVFGKLLGVQKTKDDESLGLVPRETLDTVTSSFDIVADDGDTTDQEQNW